ncbi:MAG: M20/M25/M40 family metallo-hydrolase [Desulfobacterales bacterium]|nr:M20/M25/M40 family metallo-hydrolase [Desulfobacterales bacterium]
MKKKKIIALLTISAFLFSSFTPAVFAQEDSLTLGQIYNLVKNEVDGQRALDYVAYPYLGWRNNGGPWFNNVLDWLAARLDESGYEQGSASPGDKYWFQTDIPEDEAIWEPKYASLEILGTEGDDAFDFVLNTFDPTSDYYPQDITYDWVKENIGTPEETAINERCHLARRSGFTDPIGTTPEQASGITAEVVYIGEVDYDSETELYTWTQNTDADLSGKIIFATNSRYRAYKLALQEGAAASVCSQINSYNHPDIDGEELYPNNVKYASVPNYDPDPDAPLAFNLSPQDERYLIPLLKEATEPVLMKAVAIGDYYAYSEEKPLKTLITEIEGATKPDERVIFIAHVQEPGANDNATGVGLQLELAKTLKRLIDEGTLPRPDRTFTFLWGAEYTCSYLWRDKYPDQMLNVKAALVLDMVGEDPEKTGGIMRIEKSPDPSAIYPYGLDLLPGEIDPPMTDAYIRQPDRHSLWGAGEPEFEPYPGHFLNDLYFKSATLVSSETPSFQVGSNPWEGGSDHDPFLWHTENFTEQDQDDYEPIWNPIPALLTWHFTDYVYHSSMDTLDKVSKDELRNVGVTTIGVGYMIANADEDEASEMVEIVSKAALTRFSWETANSENHLKWAYSNALGEVNSGSEIIAAVDEALELEIEILNAWGTWYKEAVMSPRDLCDSPISDGYNDFEQSYVQIIDNMLEEAVKNARQIANQVKIKSYPQGDVNGNGRIDIFDALMIAEYAVDLKDQEDIPGFAKADVDGNGTVDIYDALRIAEFDAGLTDHVVDIPAMEYIEYLSENIGMRFAGTGEERAAQDYISGEFEKLGYSVTLQPFEFEHEGTVLESFNVIAVKTGLSEKEIVVGAHYDSENVGQGASDNASGVGVMLAAAGELANSSTPYTIRFIAFGAEEVGRRGSEYFASQMTDEEVANTICMLNLDTVMGGDQIYVYGGAGDEGWVRDQALDIARHMEIPLETNPGLNPGYPEGTTGDWSDHVGFKRRGIPYAYFESTNWEIGDLSGEMQTVKHGGIWHTENDTLDFFETEFPGRIEEQLFAFTEVVTELLLTIEPPETNGARKSSPVKINEMTRKGEKF